jgi:lysophospholipase L1-like esterase
MRSKTRKVHAGRHAHAAQLWPRLHRTLLRHVQYAVGEYKAPLVPFMLEGVADKPTLFQADRLHPNAEGPSDHPGQHLADLFHPDQAR